MWARQTEVVQLYCEEGFNFGLTQKHSHSTVSHPNYSFQKSMFDNIIFVHQWSAIISDQFIILFVGIHKQHWHSHFLQWVLSTKQAGFMVMARLITAFPCEFSENQSSSDKKGTAFCDRCKNRCYVCCLVTLHTASVNRIIIPCFHLFGIGLRQHTWHNVVNRGRGCSRTTTQSLEWAPTHCNLAK